MLTSRLPISEAPLPPIGCRGQIELPDFKVTLGTYELHQDVEVRPTGSDHYVAHVVPDPGQRIVGYAIKNEFSPRPADWRAVGFVPAGMPVRFMASVGRMRVCQLRFTQEKAESLVERPLDWKFENLNAYVHLNMRPVQSAMHRLAKESLNPGLAHENLVEAISSSIIIEMCRRFAGDDRSDRTRAGTLAPWQLRKIEEFAYDQAPLGDTSIAAFARLCHVSPSHLTRAFRASTGMTIHGFVETIRIKRARALLADADLSIGDVAASVGFATPNYFATSFKRATGETPTDYRLRTLGE